MPLFKSDAIPIHPYRVAWELNEFLTEDTIYIGDGGDVVTISAQAVQPRSPGHWMDPGALGSLGVGTGFAMASKLVHPDKEVLCYYGDGSFGMTAFDMETANRFGAPYVAVIGNNSAMNQIRYGQISKYGEERGDVGNLLGDVPFSKFAEMLGWLRRGGARGVGDRAGAAACPRGGARLRQVGGRQHLGGPARVRAGHPQPDHVQVAASAVFAVPAGDHHRQEEGSFHGQGTRRRAYPGHDARAVGAHLHAACSPGSAPTCSRSSAPGVGDATRGPAARLPDVDSLYFTMLNHNKRSITLNTKTDRGKADLQAPHRGVRRAGGELRPRRARSHGVLLGADPGDQPAHHLRVGQGLRAGSLRGLQGLRERGPVHRGFGEHHRIRRRPPAGHRRPDRRFGHRSPSRARDRHRALPPREERARAARRPARCRTAC